MNCLNYWRPCQSIGFLQGSLLVLHFYRHWNFQAPFFESRSLFPFVCAAFERAVQPEVVLALDGTTNMYVTEFIERSLIPSLLSVQHLAEIRGNASVCGVTLVLSHET